MSSNINKVAVNTFFQYFELILNVLIGLISVRLILNALGASDYGIYDLLGGLIALLGFITTTLSQTSMRFISVSLGAGDCSETKKIFSSCFWLHIYIGLTLAIFLVIIGVYLFHGNLNIPKDRIDTAKVVYCAMILNLLFSVSTTPFSALLISHEKFIYVSCIRIIDSVLKLLIAILITFYAKDRLLLYGILMVCITIFNSICFILIAKIKYKKEISCKMASMKSMKGITGFAGWTILDILGTMATRQGYAILFNSFFGTIVNATFALSRQIEGHMFTISASVINTMKPQIMKSHGSGDSDRMFRLSMTAGKFGFTMMSIVAIPLLILMPDVLKLWLSNVPDGTVLFSRLMIFACMSEQLTRGLVYANQAVGNIKWFSVTVSLIRMIALPISWFLFKLGYPAYIAIVVFLICEVIGSASRVFVLSRITNFNACNFVFMVFVRILPPFIISMCICVVINYMTSGYLGLFMSIFVSVILYLTMVYCMELDEIEKKNLKALVLSYLIKLNVKSQFLQRSDK